MWLLAETDKANLLFLLGVVLASSILLLRSLRRTRRSSSASLPQTPSPSRGASAANSLHALPELQRWEVQMHETARELTARIDNKLRMLEQLIRDADERIARLETLDDAANQSEAAEDEPVIPQSQYSGLASPSASTSGCDAAEADMPQRPAKAPFRLAAFGRNLRPGRRRAQQRRDCQSAQQPGRRDRIDSRPARAALTRMSQVLAAGGGQIPEAIGTKLKRRREPRVAARAGPAGRRQRRALFRGAHQHGAI